MKKIIISVLAFSFLSLPTMAQEDGSDLNLPVDLEIQRVGWAVAPIIQCPRINKRYDELLSQLNNIKAQVQNDACKQEELNAVRDVESLENLVGPEREKFLALINKTTNGEEGEDPVELTADEVKDLQNYIDQVVRKTAVVAGFANNPACFDEGQKNSALGTLASVIGEVSGALGAVAGPFGAKLALGGKLVQGVIGSIDKIVQARKTYDFTDYEQEKAYLVSLCTYYDFKPDLEKETNTGEVIYELEELHDSADRMLGQLDESCESCREIIADFDNRLENDIPYRFVQGARDADVNSSEELEGFSSRQIAKSVEEMSWLDLMDAYFPTLRVANNVVEVPDGRSGPTMHTIRTLRTRTWALQEIQSLKALDAESLSDSGRDAVMELQERIEDVLVQHEGPRYVNFLMRGLSSRTSELRAVVSEAWENMQALERQPDPNREHRGRFDVIGIINDLFRDDINFSLVVSDYYDPDEVEGKFNRQRRDFLRALNKVRSSFAILKQRCEFYKYSTLVYGSRLERTCDSANAMLEDASGFYNQLDVTSFAARNDYLLEVFRQEQEYPYAKDWVTSTTGLLNHMYERGNQ